MTWKTKYFIYIRTLKQVQNHGLILRKAHRVIKFNQKMVRIICPYE